MDQVFARVDKLIQIEIGEEDVDRALEAGMGRQGHHLQDILEKMRPVSSRNPNLNPEP